MNPRDPKKKFDELAEKRTNKIIENLELIGNLSNKKNYTYEDSQPQEIFRAIKRALKDAEEKFKQPESPKSRKFSFNKHESVEDLIHDAAKLELQLLDAFNKDPSLLKNILEKNLAQYENDRDFYQDK